MENSCYEDLNKITKVVDRLIEWKIQDEHTISMVFEQLISLMYIAEEKLKNLYYKLLNYTRKFNEELSIDYEEIYLDQKKEYEDIHSYSN